MRGGVHPQAWEVTGWGPVWDWEPKGSSGPRRWLPAGVTSAPETCSLEEHLCLSRAGAHGTGGCPHHNPNLPAHYVGLTGPHVTVHGTLTPIHSHTLTPTVLEVLSPGQGQSRTGLATWWCQSIYSAQVLIMGCGVATVMGCALPGTGRHPFPEPLRGAGGKRVGGQPQRKQVDCVRPCPLPHGLVTPAPAQPLQDNPARGVRPLWLSVGGREAPGTARGMMPSDPGWPGTLPQTLRKFLRAHPETAEIHGSFSSQIFTLAQLARAKGAARMVRPWHERVEGSEPSGAVPSDRQGLVCPPLPSPGGYRHRRGGRAPSH